MIYEEYNRPGDIVVPLSLDRARALYQKLGLARSEAEIEPINVAFKEAVRVAEYSNWHLKLWSSLQDAVRQMLPPELAAHVISWTHDAYTGYHPANPNMSWASIILAYARGHGGWPDVGQTPNEQAQFNEFSEFFLRIWDRDAFNQSLDDLERSAVLSNWDRDIFMRYGMVPFDENGNDPLMSLRPIWKGEALRHAIRDFRFSERPDFPMERLRKAGQLYADRSWMPPGVPLGTLLEVV